MLHQVLTALLLMGVCLTVLMVTIVPKATLVAEATPRPSRAPMPIAPRATAELPEMRDQVRRGPPGRGRFPPGFLTRPGQ